MKDILNSLIGSRLAVSLVLLLLIVSFNSHSANAIEEQAIFIDEILAIVNEDIITVREFETTLELFREENPKLSAERAQQQAFEQMVTNNLQLQRAKELGIQITDRRLNQTIESIARENGLSLYAFQQRVSESGLSYSEFREKIRDELTISQVRKNQVDARIRISENEIDDLLSAQAGAINPNAEFQIAHILVALPQAANPEQIQNARQKALDLLSKAQNGEEFTNLARDFSDGPNALNGGDLGWRKAAELPTLFYRQVPNMAINEITDPVRSPNGFHLVKLMGKRNEQKVLIDEVNARHILIKPSALLSPEAAKQKLADLRAEILAGADFSELAKTHSEDTGSGADGGNLGWMSPDNFVDNFAEQVKTLPLNQLSPVFKSQFGWHIVEVLERRKQDSTAELIRTKAKQFLHKRKYEEELQRWLRELRDEAFIELKNA